MSQVFINGREKRQKKNAYKFSQTLQKEQNAWRQIKKKVGGEKWGKSIGTEDHWKEASQSLPEIQAERL